jgi:hypothetical protein
VSKIQQHTATQSFESEDTDGAGGVAVLDAGMTLIELVML